MTARYTNISRHIDRAPWSILINMLLVYVCYMVCRVVFVLENMDIYRGTLDVALWLRMLPGALRFDTSAIIYTNLPYLLLVLLPLHCKETGAVRRVTKWVYIVCNALAIAVNLMDTVYFAYAQRRTTMAVFSEFGTNTNIGSIIAVEALHHWYLVLLAAVMVAALWRAYRPTIQPYGQSRKSYYLRRTALLVVLTPLLLMGMRGYTFWNLNPPILASEANEYIERPAQAGIVLNTPFTMIRTSSRSHVSVPDFYPTLEEALSLAPVTHLPPDSLVQRRKNVVILMVESLSEEFLQAVDRPEAKDRPERLAPFIDSLYRQSLTFEQAFANGWLSNDAIPSVQASIPKMYVPYVVSGYALDETPGLAKELANLGYHAAYFHGAEDGSLGFKASARSTGITDYYGLEEYVADARTGGKADFDGMWGIWDEEFLQYTCLKLGELPQPFLATVFTLNTHHPFSIPERYRDVYPDTDPANPIKKCVRYTDMAVRRFFESARQAGWYDNTLFIILADHCSRIIARDSYRNSAGEFRIPIMIFDPSGEIEPGTRPGIAQQIDIMPTVLGYLGYDRPYASMGVDLLNTPAEQTWAFNFQEFPQYIKGDYLIQMLDFKLSGVYRYREDFSLEHNLLDNGDYDHAAVEAMEAELKALLQVTDTRLRTNTLRDPQIKKQE